MSNITNLFPQRMHKIAYYCTVSALCLTFSLITSCKEEAEADLTLLYLTDVHGLLLPHDVDSLTDNPVSMANFATYLNKVREEKGAENTLLLCGGDLNEGQSSIYYYNNVATTDEHISAQVMNYFGFNAVALGANELAAGQSVWRDRLPINCRMPYLCANLVSKATGTPMLKPYTVVEKQGFKIAILGLIDPNDCRWLSPEDIDGLEIKDLVGSAYEWVDRIKEEADPDFIIGLFAAGTRNQSLLRVPGIDVFLLGADHRSLPVNDFRLSTTGDSVLDVQPYPRLEEVAQVDLHIKREGFFGKIKRHANVQRVRLANVKPDQAYIDNFAEAANKIEKYMDTPLGTIQKPIYYADALFGPSSLVDLMHNVQLTVTGAEVSITNNCAAEVDFPAGTFRVRDLFSLYKHNNNLWVVPMTGEEIKNFLEVATAAQYNQMNEPTDHILAFRFNDFKEVVIGPNGPEMTQQKFKYCSAAGIRYTVDVTKGKNERINILSMSDGTPFDPAKTYKVAMNEYIASGGGNYIFQIGWKRDTAMKANTNRNPADLRTYFIEYLRDCGSLQPAPRNDWSVIPTDYFKKARETDAKIMKRFMSPM